jgi:hypothetical protein
MRSISKKAKVTMVAAIALAAMTGGVAYAFWSSTGTGSGSATSSAGTSNLAITQTGAPSDLAPGVASGSVTGTIKNNAPNSAYVNRLTVQVTGVDAGHAAGCSAADYGLSTTSAVLDKSSATQTLTLDVKSNLAPNGTVGFPDFTIGFANDAAASLDGCKGAVPQLSYTTD